MDTQAASNVGNPIAPKPKLTVSSSRANADASPVPTGDTVSFSKQGQDLAQQASETTNSASSDEQRKFTITENNDIVLKVIDQKTQKVVKSIPPEQQLQLRDAIRNELSNI